MPASVAADKTVSYKKAARPVTEIKEDTLTGIFLAGFLGGLLAFFMPCIYPMIPLTVSFFTKRAGSRAKGIQSASIYGLSIIIIYVALGLLITAIFGPSALNEAASSAAFNLIFFAVLVLFAVSFRLRLLIKWTRSQMRKVWSVCFLWPLH
jgi:thiol:disulfide interchange protein DsbD